MANIAASYEHAICRHLCDRTVRALAQFPNVKEIHLVGGVSANTHLRTLLTLTVAQQQGTIRWPQDIAYCTDNATMIAAAAEFLVAEQGWPRAHFTTDASIPLTEVGGAGTIDT